MYMGCTLNISYTLRYEMTQPNNLAEQSEWADIQGLSPPLKCHLFAASQDIIHISINLTVREGNLGFLTKLILEAEFRLKRQVTRNYNFQ